MLLRTRLAGFLLLATLVVTGQGCFAPGVQAPPSASKPVTLTYWRVLDNGDAFDEIIQGYRALHPNVTINYRKLRLEEYERELLNALAEDRGPDIVSLHNTWIRAYQSKLLPAPASVKLAFREVQGIQKNQVWVEKTLPVITPAQVKNQFVDQVGRDVVIKGQPDPKAGLVDQLWGLPLALDTMVLYYNKDVLNASGIPTPAQDWAEFQDHVKRMTRYDQGKLVKPAAGIGTSRNVERSFDILSLLMMQNGAVMTDANGTPIFNRMPPNLDREITPAVEALIFYTDYANPSKEVFTWDDAQPNSYDAFISGKTGYFFGYAYHLPRIRAQAPKLNFGVANIPQIDPAAKVNYANYWVEAVSKKTPNPDLAWDFLQYAAGADRAKTYFTKTMKPTALRALVNEQLNDADMGIFASQVLTAKSWYQGVNVAATEAAFNEMIDSTLQGADPNRAVNTAVQTVAQTVR
ncbi:MAG TPA: extracellular solute-binding protein [Candidatus Baltobacteraceae bacterium]|jgi:ABC-type glycerol-3-phosphate transport system substrate-binding protein|nr:extracellular solute-binding protein [Candidatus Baltobacteraceae bacterium]